METIGAPELLIVLVVVMVIFGPTRLPKLARSLGETMHEFRRGGRADDTPRNEARDADARPPAASVADGDSFL